MNASSFLLDLSERSCADLRLQKWAHTRLRIVSVVFCCLFAFLSCFSLFVFVLFPPLFSCLSCVYFTFLLLLSVLSFRFLFFFCLVSFLLSSLLYFAYWFLPFFSLLSIFWFQFFFRIIFLSVYLSFAGVPSFFLTFPFLFILSFSFF